MNYEGAVSERLKPTLKNVTNEFITSTMYRLLYSEEIPNFKVRFTESEAMEFIRGILREYTTTYGEFATRKSQEILKGLEEKADQNEEILVMVINSYQEFFEQLRQFYEQHIRLFFKRTGHSSFHSYAMKNCFELIWLRMMPEDFNDPEAFLRKQVQMIKDNTFEKYDEETCLGKARFLGDNVLCIQNKVARIWDESSQEMHIIIYDKDYYHRKELFNRPHYELPVIRYGIFEKDGKKVCCIASIQNKEDEQSKDATHKKVDRAKYKVNKGMAEVDMEKVEPKSLIAMSIFVNLLNQEGITEIEVPSMYVLDEEYHIKRSEKLIKEFRDRWPSQEVIEQDKKRYDREKRYLDRTYGKEELISEIKSERFIRIFNRLLQHYPSGEVKSYPSELDSCYHISIPRIKRKSEIKNEVLQELYGMVEKQYSDIEI